MARTRSIKPAFFTNEILASLPYQDRLLFIGLWTVADREGLLEDRPQRLRAEIFPYDHEIDVEASLTRLAHHGLIHRYLTVNSPLINVINFGKHQAPHHTEKKSILPSPLVNGEITVNIPPSTLIPSTLPPSSGGSPAKAAGLIDGDSFEKQFKDTLRAGGFNAPGIDIAAGAITKAQQVGADAIRAALTLMEVHHRVPRNGSVQNYQAYLLAAYGRALGAATQ